MRWSVLVLDLLIFFPGAWLVATEVRDERRAIEAEHLDGRAWKRLTPLFCLSALP